jgi:hypothetical protein
MHIGCFCISRLFTEFNYVENVGEARLSELKIHRFVFNGHHAEAWCYSHNYYAS